MTPKLILKDGKIMFVENWPEYIGHSTNAYIQACERAISGALEVDNPSILESDCSVLAISTKGRWGRMVETKQIGELQGFVPYSEGYTFSLPDNLDWEAGWQSRVIQGGELAGDWIDCSEEHAKKRDAIEYYQSRKIVRLFLKEQKMPENGELFISECERMAEIEEAHMESDGFKEHIEDTLYSTGLFTPEFASEVTQEILKFLTRKQP